ncbi:MAG: hypothetical protein N3E37_04120 [Candidatus Micrarchaeota archaeon]|nr:hypothetical protein [Candidatus Micrarchaeota archaeon]
MYYQDLFCKVVGGSLDVSGFITSLFPQWFVLALVGLIFSISLLIVIYFIGKLLDMPNIEAFLKLELFETLFTLMILFGIIGTTQLLCKFPVSIFFSDQILERIFGNPVDPNQVSMFMIVEKYFEQIRKYHSYALYVLGAAQIVLGISDITWQSSAGGIGIMVNPMAGYGQQSQSFNTMISILINLYLVHMVLFRALVYSAYAFFNYLLPLGIFFRCFQATRKFGGALIGLVFGFNFVYPFLILLNAKFVFETIYSKLFFLFVTSLSATIVLIVILSLFGYAKKLLVVGLIGLLLVLSGYLGKSLALQRSFFDVITDDILYALIKYQQFSANVVNEFGTDPKFEHTLAYLLAAPGALFNVSIMIIGLFLLVDVVFQTINFLIVVSSVKAITKILGEEMDISLLTRMV